MLSDERPVPSISIRSTVVPDLARNLYEVDGPRVAISNCDLQPSGAEPSVLRKQRAPPRKTSMPKQSLRSEQSSRQADSGRQIAPESAVSMSEHPGSVESTAHFVTHKSAAASGRSEPIMLPPLQKWLFTVVYVRSSDGRSTMARAVAAESKS